MRNLKINLDMYIEQMCMSAALCDSWKGDGDPLNTLVAIGHEA